jgi:hypothetical protein
MLDAYRIEIPKKGYKWRVMEAEKKPSSKGNLMLEFEVEIVQAEPVPVRMPNGETETVNINDLKVRHWIVLQPQNLSRLNQWRACLGMPPIENPADLESDDPNLYKGKIGASIVTGVKKPNLDAEGQHITNIHTGEPMFVIERRLGELMCP